MAFEPVECFTPLGQMYLHAGREYWRGLLGFHFDGDSWWGETQRAFYPRGLAIWNCPPGAVLEIATIGCDMQVMMSHDAVPARFFGFGDSFEQIAKLVEEGKDPPAWCSWKAFTPGERVRIALRAGVKGEYLGPDHGVELVMWGFCVRM